MAIDPAMESYVARFNKNPGRGNARSISPRNYHPGGADLYRERNRLMARMNDPTLNDYQFAEAARSMQNLSGAMFQNRMAETMKIYGSPGKPKGRIGPGRNYAMDMYRKQHNRYRQEEHARKMAIQAAEAKRNQAKQILARRKQEEANKQRESQLAARRAAEANRRAGVRTRQQNIARSVGGGPRSQVNSQNYYRPPARNTGGDNNQSPYANLLGGGGMGGASFFQQSMMRGFRPPPPQPYVTQRSAAGTPRASRPGRAVDFNAPNPGLSRAQGLRGRALRGMQRTGGYRGMY